MCAHTPNTRFIDLVGERKYECECEFDTVILVSLLKRERVPQDVHYGLFDPSELR